jgi:hypothetical protein
MELSLRDRQSELPDTPVTLSDPLFHNSSFQSRLKELYRQYDILCHCQNESVVMHIRHRSVNDLYFVADNPTSLQHIEDCPFHSFRKKTAEPELLEEAIRPLESFHPYVNRNPSPVPGQSNNATSYRQALPTVLKVFATLSENSFANYSFGRFVSFKDFIQKIIASEKNQKIATHWGKPLTECIHYGPQGLAIARSAVKRYVSVDSQAIPTCIWFGYAPVDATIEKGAITWKETRLTFDKLLNPFKAPGPHLLCGFIPKDKCADDDPHVRDLLMMPIVSKNYCLPVHSHEQREFAEKYLPILFGKNNQKGVTQFLKKPLLPQIEAGAALYTDWILTIKGHGEKQTAVIEHGNRHELLADIYRTKVLTPSQLLSGVEWSGI